MIRIIVNFREKYAMILQRMNASVVNIFVPAAILITGQRNKTNAWRFVSDSPYLKNYQKQSFKIFSPTSTFIIEFKFPQIEIRYNVDYMLSFHNKVIYIYGKKFRYWYFWKSLMAVCFCMSGDWKIRWDLYHMTSDLAGIWKQFSVVSIKKNMGQIDKISKNFIEKMGLEFNEDHIIISYLIGEKNQKNIFSCFHD